MNALDRHVALVGFMGAGKSSVGAEVAARLERPFLDVDIELERELGSPIAQVFAERGEAAFRELEEELTVEALAEPVPTILALGGGAVLSERVRESLHDRALTVFLEVEVEEAWRRAAGPTRPLAQDEEGFRRLYEEREPIYRSVADAAARDADAVVLAAAGVAVADLERLGELLPEEAPAALVSDAHVAGIWGAAAQLAVGPRLASTHELPRGEQAKRLDAVQRLWDELALGRDGTLVALGGGCTSDAAGFVAATYLRGIPWVPVPTTLVGQVDAAIGGKTAINLPAGKNLVGAFHWPARTLIDPKLLETLPQEQRREGMAEVVKTGLLAGEPFWELEPARMVARCAAYKSAVCLRDPYELGLRAVLNLGHTFAHALEAAGGYDEISHGRAVALGLLAALRLSGLGTDAVESVLAPRPVRVDRERAWAALGRDKKARGGRIRLVLLEKPGRPVHDVELPQDDVRAALDSLIAG
ncbi:MAG: bifunctional shikimate kinase/3-dehydroquinate synthase [Actinomycetota bacterium]|nr:bifunctional shikimate kinase/3-dehydroquinate synthase [Actinomycetota bacterium]